MVRFHVPLLRVRASYPVNREFLNRVLNTRKDELLSYADAETYANAGQGAFEMPTCIFASF